MGGSGIVPEPPLNMQLRGNFCGPVVTQPLHAWIDPRFKTPCPKNVIYTPSYACYDDHDRAIIRKAQKEQFGEWSSMVIVVTTGNIYRDHYPSIYGPDAIKCIPELLNDHINPIITTMRDDENFIQPYIPLDLIRTAFVKWEMNQPDNNNSYQMAKNIWTSKKAVRKDCKLFVHFSPKHGAGIGEEDLHYCSVCYQPLVIGEHCLEHPNASIGIVPSGQPNSNNLWWHWAKNVGVEGLFVQGEPEESVQESIDFIQDFAERFLPNVYGDLEYVLFEFKVIEVYNNVITIGESDIYNNALFAHKYVGKQPAGYMNG